MTLGFLVVIFSNFIFDLVLIAPGEINAIKSDLSYFDEK